MLIISMTDNENNTWKRNAKTKNQKETTKKSKQDRKEQGGGGEGGAEAIVKGWGLNDFVVHQFHLFITHLVTDFIIIM